MITDRVSPTKILIVNHDEASFQIQQCVAKALANLPPVELFYAHDATEALTMLDRIAPDVVVIDDEESGEKNLLIDNLSSSHPPILIQTEEDFTPAQQFNLSSRITRVPRCESLEGMHQTLMLAAALGMKHTSSKEMCATLH